jgi:hypothetical protein
VGAGARGGRGDVGVRAGRHVCRCAWGGGS